MTRACLRPATVEATGREEDRPVNTHPDGHQALKGEPLTQ
jgi:hypothetical protein